MTVKEKAEELHIEFWSLLNDSRTAKQCALICVDEILNNSQRNGKDIWRLPSDANYWQQVKTEIEKL